MTQRQGKRANYVMVAENDPHFCRFWDAYPRRVSKKEARKAWAKLNPSLELVDRILAALEWQVPAFKWDGESADYAPYPASWLNDERWTDERRKTPRKAGMLTDVIDHNRNVFAELTGRKDYEPA